MEQDVINLKNHTTQYKILKDEEIKQKALKMFSINEVYIWRASRGCAPSSPKNFAQDPRGGPNPSRPAGDKNQNRFLKVTDNSVF